MSPYAVMEGVLSEYEYCQGLSLNHGIGSSGIYRNKKSVKIFMEVIECAVCIKCAERVGCLKW